MRLLRAYASLFGAIVAAFGLARVQVLLLACMLIALTQASVFALLEGWAFLDAFYFSVVSMATVGFGDLAPTTMLGKLFCMVFLVIGIGIFVLTVSSIAQEILRHLTIAERRHGRGIGMTHGNDRKKGG